MTNCLIIGYGSIGARHARVLRELGCRVAVASRRDLDPGDAPFEAAYRSVDAALRDRHPDYVVVANRTSEHFATVTELAKLDFRGVVLIEKPLFERARALPRHRFARVFVAYNLRFHPLLQRLRDLLDGEKVLSAHAYVGQYLPRWRPGQDYRQGYSARRAQGGGALRDLSHELDYLVWLLGDWQSVTALGGHFSHLEIDSDDVFSVLLATARCPAIAVQLNYLDRAGRRELIINTDRSTLKADLVRGRLRENENVEEFTVERDETYRRQHQAILGGDDRGLCSVEAGLEVMTLVEAAEAAVAQRRWVERNGPNEKAR